MHKIQPSEITPAPTATLLKPSPTLTGSMDELGNPLILFISKGYLFEDHRNYQRGETICLLKEKT